MNNLVLGSILILIHEAKIGRVICIAGSIFGNLFRISTFGESHGKAIGVIVDGCPAGLEITAEYVQMYLDKRRPGRGKFSTKRNEKDKVEILSGIYENKTIGTPIAMIVFNEDMRSNDYKEIENAFRPGHSDYSFHKKFEHMDSRGGGRSSGRETIARVAGGSIARKILEDLGIDVFAYTKSVGDISIEKFDREERNLNTLLMPDKIAFEKAEKYLDEVMAKSDSIGGVVSCIVSSCPSSLGEPVFDKLDADLAKAMLSIGAVKAFSLGSGFCSSTNLASKNNDSFYFENNEVKKTTNNSGGILGGISDGSEIYFDVFFKATPSISRSQKTLTKDYENIDIEIKGRHDPVIMPRAVVVVESMACLVLIDLLLANISSKMSNLKKIYNKL